jgi:putative membrane protein
MGGGFIHGGIGGLLIWALTIILIVYLVKAVLKSASRTPRPSTQDRSDSLAILKARFARGEISQEEFSRMKRILSEGPT